MLDYFNISTKRLNLRRINSNDFDTLCLLLGDIEVMYAWEHSFSHEQVKQWMCKNFLRYEKDGYSYLYVEDKQGKFVGVVGLLNEDLNGDIKLGIGYILSKDAWGNGYATEAATALMEFAYNNLLVNELVLDIRPSNISSINVAKRLGFVAVGEHVKHYNGIDMPHIIFEHKRELWKDKVQQC